MKITYDDTMRFRRSTQEQIKKANDIITDYRAQGLSLTLRQIFYRFVSRGWMDNTDKEYTNLGNTLNKARLAGWLDWDAIEDRTRFLRDSQKWTSPKQIINAATNSFHLDLWSTQPEYVEVWVEKDALIDIIENGTRKYDVPHFSCRGYSSVTELHNAAMRLISKKKPVTIIHLGDHDPSGIDMTRDIFARIAVFMRHYEVAPCIVERIALNMDQIEAYKPPPNPVRMKQSLSPAYVKEFGSESWELDALEPKVMVDLIREKVEYHLDQKLFDIEFKKQEQIRKTLLELSSNYEEVAAYLKQSWRGAW